jgi:hypothetical protein
MPELSVQWSPPVMTAGDVTALAEALGRHDSIEVRLGSRLHGESARTLATGVFNLLSPDTNLDLASGDTNLSQLIPGPLPVARLGDPQRALRPRYDAQGIALDLSRWRDTERKEQSRAILAVDDASLDTADWQKQPASSVGSCQVAMAALGAGQEQSLAVLEPFLDHADAVLAHFYRIELDKRLPQLRTSLARFEGKPKPKDDPAFDCGQTYLDYVDELSACEDEKERCPFAPRVFLVGGARIGSAEPTVYIPDQCAGLVGVDVVEQLRGASREATRTGGEMFDRQWSSLADRLGALTEVNAAMEDVCAPRRRRFSDIDLTEARRRLSRIGNDFRQSELARESARWVLHDDGFHVPGIGPVQQLARFDSGDSSASHRVVQDARSLREFVFGHSRCGKPGGRLPLAAVLVDVSGKSVDFLGYFYEEELFCPELPPLLGAG